MSDQVRYLRFDPRGDEEITHSAVRCYREAFAGPPWNEWKKCLLCDRVFGRQAWAERVQKLCCGVAPVDFWPAEIVRADMEREITSDASSWIAVAQGRVVGFCWGYPITVAELERKLSIRLDRCLEFAGARVQKVIAYQDEIGVLESYRRQGIAHELFRRRLEDFRAQGLSLGAVRTMSKPPSVTYGWYTRLGYRHVAEYGDCRGTVVMALPFRKLRVP